MHFGSVPESIFVCLERSKKKVNTVVNNTDSKRFFSMNVKSKSSETMSYHFRWLENHLCVVCWFHLQSRRAAMDGRHLLSSRQQRILQHYLSIIWTEVDIYKDKYVHLLQNIQDIAQCPSVFVLAHRHSALIRTGPRGCVPSRLQAPSIARGAFWSFCTPWTRRTYEH